MPRRITSWLLIIWTALFAVWIIAAVATRPSKECGAGDRLCQDASDTGTAMGVGLILVLFFIGFVILSLVWLMTRPRRRMCPGCGREVARGLTSCPACGHAFVAAACAAVPLPPPPTRPPTP